MAMSKTSPLVGLAGAIAATDWPDPAPARAALDAMLSAPAAPAPPHVDVGHLEDTVAAVSDARKRRRAAEIVKRREREAARRAARVRTRTTPHISIPDLSTEPARDEPEMEF